MKNYFNFSFLNMHVSAVSKLNYLHPPGVMCIKWIVLKTTYLLFWLWNVKEDGTAVSFPVKKNSVQDTWNALVNNCSITSNSINLIARSSYQNQPNQKKKKIIKRTHTPNTQLRICIWQLLTWLIHKKLLLSFLSYSWKLLLYQTSLPLSLFPDFSRMKTYCTLSN